jgi:hypothetical protein
MIPSSSVTLCLCSSCGAVSVILFTYLFGCFAGIIYIRSEFKVRSVVKAHGAADHSKEADAPEAGVVTEADQGAADAPKEGEGCKPEAQAGAVTEAARGAADASKEGDGSHDPGAVTEAATGSATASAPPAEELAIEEPPTKKQKGKGKGRGRKSAPS